MENKIGSMWISVSKNGNEYLSGIINDKRVVMFRNNKKKSDKSPDYQIFLSDDGKPKQEYKQEPSTPYTSEDDEVWSDDSLPF